MNIETILDSLDESLPDETIPVSKWFESVRNNDSYRKLLFLARNIEQVRRDIYLSYLGWWMDGVSESEHPWDTYLATLLLLMHESGQNVEDLSRQAARLQCLYWTQIVAIQCLLDQKIHDQVRQPA